MAVQPTPQKSPRHFRAFLTGLGILVLGLAVLLFAVDMEATATARGVVTSRGRVEVRGTATGLIDLAKPVKLGEEVRPGDLLATIRGPGAELTKVLAPEGPSLWLVVGVNVAPGEAVHPGQPLLTLDPLDPQTRRPAELLALLDVPEEHVAEITPGQTVRLASDLYNERIHGKFPAVVERIEPMARVDEKGKRFYRVTGVIQETPLRLLLGSGVKAEIVLGRKKVYRIILEH